MKHHLAALAALGTLACTETPTLATQSVHTDDGLYMVAYSTDPTPPLAGDTVLMLEIMDVGDNHAPVLDAVLDIEPWMPAMNHGIMGDVTVMEMGEGTYEAEWAYSMPGGWEVTVDVDADAGTDSVVLGFEVE